jgi:hypothetical protein
VENQLGVRLFDPYHAGTAPSGHPRAGRWWIAVRVLWDEPFVAAP